MDPRLRRDDRCRTVTGTSALRLASPLYFTSEPRSNVHTMNFPCNLSIPAFALILTLGTPLHAREAPSNGANAEVDAAGSAPAEDVRPDVGEGPKYLGSVSVDPAGFLLFGPTVHGEVGLGPVAVGAGFRWLSPGLLANALFLGGGSDQFAFSYGISLHGNYFFQERLRGFHAGLALEYLQAQVDNPSTGIASISSYFVPQIEGGYRLPLGRFFIGGVVALGYAAQVGSRSEALTPGANPGLFGVSDESSPYGSARLDVGVYF